MERTNIGLLLAKAEVTYGTDPVPTGAANVIATTRSGLTFSPNFTRLTRRMLDGSTSKVGGKNTMGVVSFSFQCEIRGNRTNGSTPDISAGAIAQKIELDCLLQACDLAPTYTAESGGGVRDGFVVYNPTNPSDQGNSVTIYWYSGLKLHKIIGCKGTVKAVLEAGKMGYLDFSFSGLYVAVTDASIPSPTWLDTKPPAFVAANSQVGAYSPVFTKLDFDLGNTITQRDDANSANAVKGFIITDRNSKATIDPESVAEATAAFWDDLNSTVSRAITATIGSQTGNKFLITLVGEPDSQSYGDRSGLRTQQISYEMCRANNSSAINSEVALKFS